MTAKMRLPPLSVLCVNYFLFGVVSLITDQVYCYFKFTGDISGAGAFCYLDNFFYGWYYRLCTVFYLIMSGMLLLPNLVPPRSLFWYVSKQLTYWSLFAESEALCQFVYASREIEYTVDDVRDQKMLYLFVSLAVVRWALALFATNHSQVAMEWLHLHHYGYSVPGYGLTANRTKLNQHCGWASQLFADYVVVHYLLYYALFGARSEAETLALLDGSRYADTDQFYRHQSLLRWVHRVTQSLYLSVASWFYVKFIRKEITLYNFIM